jgi:hypothetical protein
VALAVLLAIGGLSRGHYTATDADRAELRLAWAARAPRVEECRHLSAEEIEALPVHMRREEVCEGRLASYRLEVSVDGHRVRRVRVEGSGARGDRPLHVYESIPVRPGQHTVRVVFARIGAHHADEEDDERGEGRVPDRLTLTDTLDLPPRGVALVTWAPERGRLERVGDGKGK